MNSQLITCQSELGGNKDVKKQQPNPSVQFNLLPHLFHKIVFPWKRFILSDLQQVGFLSDLSYMFFYDFEKLKQYNLRADLGIGEFWSKTPKVKKNMKH